MKFIQSILLVSLGLGLGSAPLSAQYKVNLEDPRQKTSYAIGLDAILTFRQQQIDVDARALLAGVADSLAGNPRLTADQKKEVIVALFKRLSAKADEQRKIDCAENLRAGQAFLAANAKREAVRTLPLVAPDGSAAELQYRVLKTGSGASPGLKDIVELHYEGRHLDGTVFDSSVQRSTPVTFGLDDMLPGWRAVMPLMKAGDKWRLFIPGPLAFGESGPPQLGANRTLIYDLELLSFYTPESAPPAAASPAAAPVPRP